MKMQYHVETAFTPKERAFEPVVRKFYFDTTEEQEQFMSLIRARTGWKIQRYGITHRLVVNEAMVQCMEVEAQYQ